MGYGEFIRETISLNKNDLVGNAELALDLLSDDFLMYLGYEKRKERGIRKVSSHAYKVEVSGQDKFIIEFRGYGDKLENVDTKYFEGGYKLVALTDGLSVALYDNDNGLLLKSPDIANIKDKLSNGKINIPQLVLDSKEKKLDTAKASEAVKANLNSLVTFLLGLEKIDDTQENRETLAKAILSGGGNGGNAEAGNAEAGNAEAGDKVGCSGQTGDDTESFANKEKDYRNQITNLTTERETLAEELLNVKNELKALKESQITEKEAKLGIAKTLIEAVEDDPDSDRLYVGAINSKLFQSKELGKFIGNCITELYSIVKFKLMTVIYDSDLFKFNTPATRVDFIINNKKYEIDFSHESEQSAIGKLQILFEKFPEDCIAFECKLVGQEPDFIQEIGLPVVEEEWAEEEEEVDLFDESDDGDPADSEQGSLDDDLEGSLDGDLEGSLDGALEGSLDGAVNLEEDILFDDRGLGGDAEVIFIGETDNIGNTGIATSMDIGDMVCLTKTITVPLSRLGEVVWAEGVELTSIDYVWYSGKRFRISNDGDISRTLSKLIEAELSLTDDMDKSIQKLKSYDCTEISAFIQEINTENRRNQKIPFTGYVFTGIDSYIKCVPIVSAVADILALDKELIYLHITIETELSTFDGMVVDYSDAETDECTDFGVASGDETVQCILLGNIVDNITLTRNSLDIQRQIIQLCLAVKTKYLVLDISEDDGKREAIKEILSQADNEFDINSVGNILDTEYKVLSDTEDAVANEHYEVIVGGTTYYVSEMEDWQFFYALIKLHTVICKNKQIAIKCLLDKDAVSFYDKQFNSMEPSLTLSVKTLINYIKPKIR